MSYFAYDGDEAEDLNLEGESEKTEEMVDEEADDDSDDDNEE